MKLIIELGDVEFNSIEHLEEVFKEYYEGTGYLLNKDWRCIYKVIDTDIIPSEGQRVAVDDEWYIVDFSIISLKNDIKTFHDYSRIVIKEE